MGRGNLGISAVDCKDLRPTRILSIEASELVASIVDTTIVHVGRIGKIFGMTVFKFGQFLVYNLECITTSRILPLIFAYALTSKAPNLGFASLDPKIGLTSTLTIG